MFVKIKPIIPDMVKVPSDRSSSTLELAVCECGPVDPAQGMAGLLLLRWRCAHLSVLCLALRCGAPGSQEGTSN